MVKFIEYCFTTLMDSIKRDIDRQSSHIEEKDFNRLLKLVAFCIGFFNEYHKDSLSSNGSIDEVLMITLGHILLLIDVSLSLSSMSNSLLLCDQDL
jgi:hypothetical protein